MLGVAPSTHIININLLDFYHSSECSGSLSESLESLGSSSVCAVLTSSALSSGFLSDESLGVSSSFPTETKRDAV